MTQRNGYPDQFRAQGPDRIEFKVSMDLETFHASIVRFIHLDANRLGFREELLEYCRLFPGGKRAARPGSYGLIDNAIPVGLDRSVRLDSPTTPASPAREGILNHASPMRTVPGGA